MKRILCAVPAAFLLAGCSVAGFVGDALGLPVTEKVVSSKLEPSTLVAIDASSCTVSRRSWEKAEVGRPYVCLWRTRSGPGQE